MTSDEQLERWANGDPVHNREPNECCPDFSCCRPELLAPADIRQRFLRANESTRHQMLGMFLGAALSAAGINAYIAGVDDPEEEG